jgi:hypothetical protein
MRRCRRASSANLRNRQAAAISEAALGVMCQPYRWLACQRARVGDAVLATPALEPCSPVYCRPIQGRWGFSRWSTRASCRGAREADWRGRAASLSFGAREGRLGRRRRPCSTIGGAAAAARLLPLTLLFALTAAPLF